MDIDSPPYNSKLPKDGGKGEKQALSFQVISDLHLEFKGAYDDVSELIPIKADILICAGDIGNVKFRYFELFFEWAAKNFKHVLYVAGNHEFYFHEYHDVLVRMNKAADQFENVHFLHRNKFEIGNTIFLGVTLWMNPPKHKRSVIQSMYNDFKQITYKSEGDATIRQLRLVDTMRFCHQDLEYLKSELNDIKKKFSNKPQDRPNVVIISHHVPLRGVKFLRLKERHPIFRDVMFGTCADCSCFLLEYFDWFDGWVHGHSHYSFVTTYSKQDLQKECKEYSNREEHKTMESFDDAEEEVFGDSEATKEIARQEKEEEEEEEEEKEKEPEEEDSGRRIWLISNQIGYPHQRDRRYQRALQFSLPLNNAPPRSQIPEPKDPVLDADSPSDENKPKKRTQSGSKKRPSQDEQKGKISKFFSGVKSLLFGDLGLAGSVTSEYSNHEEDDELLRSQKRRERMRNICVEETKDGDK